jgi:hypothetical protein
LFFGADELNAASIQTLDPSDPADMHSRHDDESVDFVSEVHDQVPKFLKFHFFRRFFLKSVS